MCERSAKLKRGKPSQKEKCDDAVRAAEVPVAVLVQLVEFLLHEEPAIGRFRPTFLLRGRAALLAPFHCRRFKQWSRHNEASFQDEGYAPASVFFRYTCLYTQPAQLTISPISSLSSFVSSMY